RKVQHLRRCIWTSLNKADDVICLHQDYLLLFPPALQYAALCHAALRIWGLNAFDPSQGNLLLPRLEWRR
ncbi:hypothetical protein ACUOFC_68490, partial [Escherichia sp. TWPC-MK]